MSSLVRKLHRVPCFTWYGMPSFHSSSFYCLLRSVKSSTSFFSLVKCFYRNSSSSSSYFCRCYWDFLLSITNKYREVGFGLVDLSLSSPMLSLFEELKGNKVSLEVDRLLRAIIETGASNFGDKCERSTLLKSCLT